MRCFIFFIDNSCKINEPLCPSINMCEKSWMMWYCTVWEKYIFMHVCHVCMSMRCNSVIKSYAYSQSIISLNSPSHSVLPVTQSSQSLGTRHLHSVGTCAHCRCVQTPEELLQPKRYNLHGKLTCCTDNLRAIVSISVSARTTHVL